MSSAAKYESAFLMQAAIVSASFRHGIKMVSSTDRSAACWIGICSVQCERFEINTPPSSAKARPSLVHISFVMAYHQYCHAGNVQMKVAPQSPELLVRNVGLTV